MGEELTLAVFGAHVVGRVRGPCCGTCSGPMLWDVFGAHVVLHGHDVEMGVDAMGGGGGASGSN